MANRAQLRLRGGAEVTAERVLPRELAAGDRLVRWRKDEQVVRTIRAVSKRLDAVGVRYHVALDDVELNYESPWFEVTPKGRVWRVVEP